MKLKPMLILIPLGLAALVGCTNDTSVSREVTKADLEVSTQKQLSDIDKMNVPEGVKQRMRDHLKGGTPGAQSRQ